MFYNYAELEDGTQVAFSNVLDGGEVQVSIDLGGTYRGHRECHIEPDWLLIYRIDEGGLVLVATRTGSHSELLGL